MQNYTTFFFDSCSFDPRDNRIELKYGLDEDIQFTESFIIPPSDHAYDPDALKNALFGLHLAAGVSYYKTCTPKKISVRSGTLSKEQAQHWNTVYEKGLGQFFYENMIDFSGLIDFPVSDVKRLTSNENPKPETRNPKRLLVPIGGGKDSMVTIELLRAQGYDITLFRVGQHPFIDELAKAAKLPLLTIDRHLAPELFTLNAEGALNGHVPVTNIVSWVAVVTAILHGFDAVVMSNERSASIGNVPYLGMEINHQWSKSLEMEKMFQAELRRSGIGVEVFSLLRSLSELHIALLFADHPEYFFCTTSCNTNWRILKDKNAMVRRAHHDISRWCCTCPKCAFVFAILSAFIEKETLVKIFGKNLFEDESLLPLFLELLGEEGFKPFECVGTPEETKAALLLALDRGEYDDTPLMEYFAKEVLPEIADNEAEELVMDALKASNEHLIPTDFQPLLSSL